MSKDNQKRIVSKENCCCYSYRTGITPCQCGCHRNLLSQQEAKIKRELIEMIEDTMKGMSPILFWSDGKNHLSDVEKQKIVLENALSNIKKLLNE